jgi:hypothetical protein
MFEYCPCACHKGIWAGGGIAPHILTFALEEGKSASHIGHLASGEGIPSTHGIGDPMGSAVCLDLRKISCPSCELKHVPSVKQSIA